MACDCFDEKNAELKASHDAVLNGIHRHGFAACVIDVYHPDDIYNQNELPYVVADFCPFCGVRYVPAVVQGDESEEKA